MADQKIQAADLPKRYIAMPKETTFLEACCHNDNWKPGVVLVPVTAEFHPEVTGLYEADLKTERVTKLCPLPATGLFFGCKVTDEGVCYVCVGNERRVVAVDLSSSVPSAVEVAKFPGEFEPNDVAVDVANNRLLICCNDMPYDVMTTKGQILNSLKSSAKQSGTIFSVPLLHSSVPLGSEGMQVFASGFKVLAGSVCVPADGALWVSELNNLARVPLDGSKWERFLPFDKTLLADNMEVIGDEVVAFPYYRQVSRLEAVILTSTPLSRMAYGLASCCNYCVINKVIQEDKETELRVKEKEIDPEVGRTAPDVFEDVCFGFYNIKTKEMKSVRVDVAHKGFDGHCTHMERVKSDLVFINYLKHEILVVDAASILC
uniref:SMP-30/Gluconolactonase/LRE-like region domain-containing protein n=1 Tax=Chromera velia CCMP2878 TaxID=1169474 RepID=A0A0G4I9E5_9ALVE|mmetsp:Transcript_47403/g.93487  ORF Transcript_47403/g.93487 Transcript_47403/m.93487 type:complete len:375 (+) Transcript_47403:130-1254(+)|eukprot:Cvel_12212.t1-p1 / transcript=Cvel_12212.t1 / gene=Cvel_12212 / organism=Chromera_velia_CCMP2878 / gene_product=hypothetical protein / transcript_product=hypothetical protein / location=Cvel_scaffold790:6833-7954(-) / protein_length=374 / sequence_SO=supercontig / SO=protein_coding / is_pseudo=false